MSPLDTTKLYSISSDLKSLNEVLRLENTKINALLDGTYITEELHEAELGLLDVVRTNHVRRRAAPILQRLLDMGVTVDVTFDYTAYLPKDDTDVLGD